VRSPDIVEVKIPSQGCLRLGDRIVGPQIDFLVLHAFPQPLDEDVVAQATLAVHADLDAVFLEQPGEFQAGELAALVSVEDLRGSRGAQWFPAPRPGKSR
jgi:hypothetical protein